jgi:hypothetical protein
MRGPFCESAQIIIGVRLVCKQRPHMGCRNSTENFPMLPKGTTCCADPGSDLQSDFPGGWSQSTADGRARTVLILA